MADIDDDLFGIGIDENLIFGVVANAVCSAAILWGEQYLDNESHSGTSILTLDDDETTSSFDNKCTQFDRSSSQADDKVTKWIAACRLAAQAQEPLNRFKDAATTNSNGKGKVRVQVESEVSLSGSERGSDLEDQEDTKQKRRNRPTNSDLPSGLDNRTWRTAVLPSFLNFIGSFRDPWRIDKTKVITHMQPILNHFLPLNQRHTLHEKDAMMGLINQRPNDWRSSFGSTAITVLDSFFRGANLDTQQLRQDVASKLLERDRFLYEKTEKRKGQLPRRRIGIFHGPLVLKTFAAHLKAVHNVNSVIPNMDPLERPVGALALAAVAVERVLKLWVDGHIRINKNGGKSILVAAMSTTSGKVTTRVHNFSADKWRRSTAVYVQQAMNLDHNRFDRIVEEAKKYIVPHEERETRTFDVEFDD